MFGVNVLPPDCLPCAAKVSVLSGRLGHDYYSAVDALLVSPMMMKQSVVVVAGVDGALLSVDDVAAASVFVRASLADIFAVGVGHFLILEARLALSKLQHID